jgi:hypothetical protein
VAGWLAGWLAGNEVKIVLPQLKLRLATINNILGNLSTINKLNNG